MSKEVGAVQAPDGQDLNRYSIVGRISERMLLALAEVTRSCTA